MAERIHTKVPRDKSEPAVTTTEDINQTVRDLELELHLTTALLDASATLVDLLVPGGDTSRLPEDAAEAFDAFNHLLGRLSEETTYRKASRAFIEHQKLGKAIWEILPDYADRRRCWYDYENLGIVVEGLCDLLVSEERL